MLVVELPLVLALLLVVVLPLVVALLLVVAPRSALA